MTKGIPLNDIDRERWLLSILSEGTEKAKVIASKNLKEIKEIVGFI